MLSLASSPCLQRSEQTDGRKKGRKGASEGCWETDDRRPRRLGSPRAGRTEPAHVAQAAPPRRADSAVRTGWWGELGAPCGDHACTHPRQHAWSGRLGQGPLTLQRRRAPGELGPQDPEPAPPEQAGVSRPDQMFAIQPGIAEGVPLVGSLPPGVCQPELQPDSNSNFMDSAKDANENWHGIPGKVEPILMRNSSELPSDNQAFQGTGFPEGAVRSPPEGAEIPGAEPEKLGGAGSICSPLEDIGYASSSLSINSLSSSPESSCGTPGGPGSPDPLLPCVAQAVQQLQAQERYKELEKEKHHVHLVMYRRLALLQWIRALQHQLVDQQSRLQESFDTILDNRKELIRCLQQRAAPSRAQDQG